MKLVVDLLYRQAIIIIQTLIKEKFIPALLEPTDDIKIQLARIVGFNSLDQCDSLTQELLDYIEFIDWNATPENLIATGLVTKSELIKLGATKVA